MSGISHFKEGAIEVNGIELHYVERGSGPLVVFCHGRPVAQAGDVELTTKWVRTFTQQTISLAT
ncbi:hypothetical protein OAB62_01410 [Pseudomonadales bacterium]|nr:hypothetical protein [Pseudomonadales bacterium]|tara:strand:+ start:763 stop:954 length:192 start_codon:yes stop_codon:yes gene_type:complete